MPGDIPPEPPLISPSRSAAAEAPPAAPEDKVELLLRPWAGCTPGRLAKLLGQRLEARGHRREDHDLAFNDAYVACRLDFRDLLCEALPLAHGWDDEFWPGEKGSFGALVKRHRKQFIAALGPTAPRVQGRRVAREFGLPGDVVWFVSLVGRIAWERAGGYRRDRPPTAAQIVDAAVEPLRDLEVGTGASADATPLWTISRNRPVSTAVWRSRIACKVDAATTLFNLSCRDVRWAVIDSGIDARHPAFARRKGDKPVKTTGEAALQSADSRIVGTYDFAGIRRVLAGLPLDPDKLPDRDADEADRVEKWVRNGRAVDWDEVAPKLERHHGEGYDVPKDDHGTHVAGILAGDWRTGDKPTSGPQDVQGMCPDMELYDLRAFDDNGSSDEFQILSAMQFVRHLNAHSDEQRIHGVNLSFSLRHEVDKYAAGATPVCEEAHRLVGSGVVVVAAAGNDGRGGYYVRGRNVDGYRSVSITDPGNAEKVITVGATHREKPHTYGVSYFSSRGPTGDGRAKPDLVAPGERISSPIPGGEIASKDGTSQAAPHVSGACALLMARHPELMGKPEDIKRILIESCTDLGRERAFQGAGVVDILRAIQAV